MTFRETLHERINNCFLNGPRNADGVLREFVEWLEENWEDIEDESDAASELPFVGGGMPQHDLLFLAQQLREVK